MSTISAIDITHHQLVLDPPFPASWDPQPRTRFPVTIVRVRDSDGRVGVGSGDAMYGFGDYARWFLGEDPLDLHQHAARLANIGFHGGPRAGVRHGRRRPTVGRRGLRRDEGPVRAPLVGRRSGGRACGS